MQVIKHINHNLIDFKKWDNAILSSPIPYVFAQSYYLNATCPNWSALIYGDYESVFPITDKLKFGIKYLPQPSFTSQLGTYGKINLDVENQFCNYIITHFKLIEIELNSFNTISPKGASSKKTHIINYSEGYSYNQNTKRNIAKAKANNFKIEKTASNKIVEYSKKYINPFLLTDLKLSKNTILIFDAIIQNCVINNSIINFIITDTTGNVRAIAHFVYNNDYVVFLKGTNFDKSENSGSMHLLLDFAINYFSDKCKWFDFGGGSLNEGLAGFYKGLGGRELTYSYLRVNNLPKFIKLFKN